MPDELRNPYEPPVQHDHTQENEPSGHSGSIAPLVILAFVVAVVAFSVMTSID